MLHILLMSVYVRWVGDVMYPDILSINAIG